ncbi:potassium channel family protein [Methanotorris igneus]|uniref:TrkA-N domain protein n=1 Tax=Methanotorris igneus (strain DSM 5666 / JCM 11834 / Kol 5) TaxID=880724 RepID=F6BDX6_METIK|nr:TrkA-N domain protein [Methanotorris igneus Kol 5]
MDTLNKIKLGMVTIGALILFASIGFMFLEGWDFFTALYVSIVTISTVGYGDYTPTTHWGKALVMVYIVTGVGAVAYTFGSIAEFFMEGHFKKVARMRKMEKNLKKLKGHFIICGYGKLGKVVAEKFKNAKVPFVVIDSDEKMLEEEAEKDPDLIYVVGDATSDDVLIKAGIERARGLISVVNTNAENVFITLSAKRLNPNIYVVAKAEDGSAVDKLLKAGADRVVSPNVIGGSRIAEIALKPEVLDFVSTIMDDSYDMEIEKFCVCEGSEICGKSLYESQIRSKTGVTILAVKKGNDLIINPSPDVVVDKGDEIYAFGTKEQLEKLEKILNKTKKRKNK